MRMIAQMVRTAEYYHLWQNENGTILFYFYIYSVEPIIYATDVITFQCNCNRYWRRRHRRCCCHCRRHHYGHHRSYSSSQADMNSKIEFTGVHFLFWTKWNNNNSNNYKKVKTTFCDACVLYILHVLSSIYNNNSNNTTYKQVDSMFLVFE